eukprot:scaffold200_cov173-Amphora_coffeaeformis.AAC.17
MTTTTTTNAWTHVEVAQPHHKREPTPSNIFISSLDTRSSLLCKDPFYGDTLSVVVVTAAAAAAAVCV